ncbi:AMP-binding protein [Neptunicella sp. SCSIO 80796]|uniref:AMP-binding protein n=1 Tax=Neptunicella plasticusilytica TaxID=3117012 RepID=UPI003A4D6065
MTKLKVPAAQLFHLAGQTPDEIFFRQPVDGKWQEHSYASVAEQTRLMASALLDLGFVQGEKIAIFAKNCMEWMIADWAIGLAGCISVPIFSSADRDTIDYVMEHSEAKAVFVGKLDNRQHYHEVFNSDIMTIAMPYPTIACQKQWHELLADTLVRTEFPTVTSGDVMTIIYTSGSTGTPKGVVLEYQSYMNACHHYIMDIQNVVTFDRERYLSYLPLAHITERVLGQGMALYVGIVDARQQISFVESLASFADNLTDCSPTIFISVPRLWQKFQLGILSKISQAKLDILLRIPLISGLIKKKVISGLGLSQVKLCASGSAPIGPDLLAWYERLGINISQGWGMSETNAAGTTQVPYRSDKRTSIGRPLLNMDIRIGDNQEIQVKSDCLMREYYKQPALTAEAFTRDGYFRTGDQGVRDEDGYIHIIGRLKDIFKTAKGKYVAPAPIEAALAKSVLFDQLCVVGINLSQPVVLAVLSDIGKNQSRQSVENELIQLLDKINTTLEKHEKLDGIWILQEAWTVENEMITPTLKIRRQNIEKRFESLYSQPLPSKVSWQ